jgi:hypothetical protein
MPGLVPGIHVLLRSSGKDVDGRVKPGHDDEQEKSPAPVGENRGRGLLVRSRLAHIRLRGARTDRSDRYSFRMISRLLQITLYSTT